MGGEIDMQRVFAVLHPAIDQQVVETRTVLTDVADDMKVFAEENFGPIAAITRFSIEDEVIARANASDMGLSAYAFIRSPDRARRMVAGLKAGMVGINSFALAASEAPFGGTNHSGMGREGGIEGISDYPDTKLAQIVFRGAQCSSTG